MELLVDTNSSFSWCPTASRRMQLRYGFNEIDAWWHVSFGQRRPEIQRQLRMMRTAVIRVFVFDKPVPNPITNWDLFVGYIQAVLDVGAVPMVTFAKYPPPYDNPRHLRTFIARCSDIVYGCIDQWGGRIVCDWMWCIWNEPNNLPVGGALSFLDYLTIYQQTAQEIYRILAPYLDGRKAFIGGPALDGFQPYWLDWISGLLNQIDNTLIGFVSWHQYGDWRPVVPSSSLGIDLSGSPDAPNGPAYETLLMAQTPVYEARARGVSRIIAGRNVLNVCGELNTIVNHDYQYVGGLNQNIFGAAYYASVLIHLLRGGADLEMRWVATSNDDAYGVITKHGEPTPVSVAKQMFVQYVRHLDWVRFPTNDPCYPDCDAVIACGPEDRCSGVYVNTSRRTLHIPNVSDQISDLSNCHTLLRLDDSTSGKVVYEPFNGSIHLEGYGLVVVTNSPQSYLELPDSLVAKKVI